MTGLPPADMDSYFAILRKHLSPAELDEILKVLGSPARVRQFSEALESIADHAAEIGALVQKERDRAAIWKFMKVAALAFVTAITVMGAIKALLPPGIPW